MNKNAKKWLKSLRSGEYDQGKGRLRTEDSFCCLGVACDISGLGRWEGDIFYTEGDYFHIVYLPEAVMSWLGITTRSGKFFNEDKDIIWSLSDTNDEGKSFAEIADLIEKHQDDLFDKKLD